MLRYLVGNVIIGEAHHDPPLAPSEPPATPDTAQSAPPLPLDASAVFEERAAAEEIPPNSAPAAVPAEPPPQEKTGVDGE